jgi:hypothetical protein
MHLFLATTKREVFAQLPGVPSGARYGRRCSILCSKGERNASQFLPKVLAAESPGFVSI